MSEKQLAASKKEKFVRTAVIGFFGFILGAPLGGWLSFLAGIRFYKFFLAGMSDSMAGAGAFGLMIIMFGISGGGYLGAVGLLKLVDYKRN